MGTDVGRGALGWIPTSGEIRNRQEPEVAMSATTKTMIARPMAAMKYSARERPRRRRLFIAAMLPQAGL
ncbi:MAG: hypothetical protein A2Y78_06440 [Acidobacteria bacterium RBG_13_68_16]|nr:MAG: hypothetical protein A2Y78_06440 [Acidobacteria bacterium RBG_13_68_16]